MMLDLHSGRQTFAYDCGAKTLQLVMAYYGVEVREDALIAALGTGEHGTPIRDMIAVARSHGLGVHAKTGWSLHDVKRMVESGHPVIVLLQAWANRFMTLDDWRTDDADGHYAILIGDAKGVLLFEDPASFRRTWLREREFLARWHDRDDTLQETYEHFAMVLTGRPPAPRVPEHMD